MSKKKLTVYIAPEVHECLMRDVLERVNKEHKFRGLLSEAVEEILRNHYGTQLNMIQTRATDNSGGRSISSSLSKGPPQGYKKLKN